MQSVAETTTPYDEAYYRERHNMFVTNLRSHAITDRIYWNALMQSAVIAKRSSVRFVRWFIYHLSEELLVDMYVSLRYYVMKYRALDDIDNKGNLTTEQYVNISNKARDAHIITQLIIQQEFARRYLQDAELRPGITNAQYLENSQYLENFINSRRAIYDSIPGHVTSIYLR